MASQRPYRRGRGGRVRRDHPCAWPAACTGCTPACTGKYTLITCHPNRGCKGIEDAGVLARFRGVAVHDAWAPYDTSVDADHQLCCAHAQRELAAVAEAAEPDADWCWATQAADALVAMQKLLAEAIAASTDALDPDVLAKQVQLYRSAAQIGITATAARTSNMMNKHHALARRLLDRQDDYLRFTTDWRIPADNNGSERDIRMIKIRQRYPAACAPSPGPDSSARSAAASPPPPNTAATSSTPSSCSPRANPGYPRISNHAATT